MTEDLFQPWLRRWRLTADGEGFVTAFHSHLLPVLTAEGEPAMLKLALNQEEREGARLMAWYGGLGAARVLAHAPEALLLERAMGRRSLREMAQSGQDDAASAVICQVIAALHAPRAQAAPAMLAPLPAWFRQLEPAAAAHGGVLAQAAVAAKRLLAAPREPAVLHGDIHHDNILDGGPRGWLAIDPKGLRGEAAYDYANLFCNPDLTTATAPGRLARRVAVVAAAAGIEPRRLLTWVLAYAGLSAAWTIGHGDDPALALAVAAIAAAELAAG
ncbi:MAG: aminoglycoside phosphotransferase family protein [Caulobacteraceae bacterium]